MTNIKNIALGALFISTFAHANLLEDMFGAGARTKAMASAGVASANDYSGVYYNPAQLSQCENSSLAMSYQGFQTSLWQKNSSGTNKPGQIGSKHNLGVGGCLKLPASFKLGVYTSLNPLSLVQIHIQSTTTAPVFPLYQDGINLPSLYMGGSYDILENLSIGLAISLSIGADINTTADISSDIYKKEFEADVQSTVDVTLPISVVAGLSYSPIDELTFGAAYRTSSASGYRANTDISGKLSIGGVNLTGSKSIPNSEGFISFSPQQAAFGVAGRPIKGLELTSDATWYDFGRYQGPFITNEDVGFSSIVVPRVGVEYIIKETLAVRLGYSYRATPAPSVTQQYLNLIDNDVHTITAGLGAKVEISKKIKLSVDAYGSLGLMVPIKTKTLGSFGGQIYDFGIQTLLEY